MTVGQDRFQAPPTLDWIRDAARRLRGYAVNTPVLENPGVNRRLGGRLLIKAESLQRTGSFKARGAFNRISMIPEDSRHGGVVAYSSGNHAQGVAAAARHFDIPCRIVMPADAPAIKLRQTRALGAEIRTYDRFADDRMAIAADWARETGAAIIPPYDDAGVIAGQGTVGLEIAGACDDLGLTPDLALICCGGGGLSAGTAMALRDRYPNLEIRVVEPAGFDDTGRSLADGHPVDNGPGRQSICDALLAPRPGALTFAINRGVVDGGLAVDDDAVLAAMATACTAYKLVLEPGGAVTLAAALSGAISLEGRVAVAVASGGNVDPAMLARALAQA